MFYLVGQMGRKATNKSLMFSALRYVQLKYICFTGENDSKVVIARSGTVDWLPALIKIFLTVCVSKNL